MQIGNRTCHPSELPIGAGRFDIIENFHLGELLLEQEGWSRSAPRYVSPAAGHSLGS